MFEQVNGLLFEALVWAGTWKAGLASRREHWRQQEVVIVETVPTNLPHFDKGTFWIDVKNVNCLMLNREHSQGIFVEIEPLVV